MTTLHSSFAGIEQPLPDTSDGLRKFLLFKPVSHLRGGHLTGRKAVEKITGQGAEMDQFFGMGS